MLVVFLLVPFFSSMMSTFHLIDFVHLGNIISMSWLLALTVELGSLVSFVTISKSVLRKIKKGYIVFIFGILFVLQAMGNVYSSFDYINQMLKIHPDWLASFMEMMSRIYITDISTTKFILSLIIGLPIPLISLILLKSAVDYIYSPDDISIEEQPKLEEPAFIHDLFVGTDEKKSGDEHVEQDHVSEETSQPSVKSDARPIHLEAEASQFDESQTIIDAFKNKQAQATPEPDVYVPVKHDEVKPVVNDEVKTTSEKIESEPAKVRDQYKPIKLDEAKPAVPEKIKEPDVYVPIKHDAVVQVVNEEKTASKEDEQKTVDAVEPQDKPQSSDVDIKKEIDEHVKHLDELIAGSKKINKSEKRSEEQLNTAQKKKLIPRNILDLGRKIRINFGRRS